MIQNALQNYYEWMQTLTKTFVTQDVINLSGGG